MRNTVTLLLTIAISILFSEKNLQDKNEVKIFKETIFKGIKND